MNRVRSFEREKVNPPSVEIVELIGFSTGEKTKAKRKR
jgi:hypothetical protein